MLKQKEDVARIFAADARSSVNSLFEPAGPNPSADAFTVLNPNRITPHRLIPQLVYVTYDPAIC
jgi:hypothetical protein